MHNFTFLPTIFQFMFLNKIAYFVLCLDIAVYEYNTDRNPLFITCDLRT